MSLIFDNQKNKEKCQKFTPSDAVKTMLDMAGYTTSLFGKKVLENSFGSGNVLYAIVMRYIEDSLSHNISLGVIAKGLSEDIYGIELDKKLYDECLIRLNNLLSEYKIPPVKWNIYSADALKWENDNLFDFIIGNPPYITYRDIDLGNRKFIRQKFTTCQVGKFDYCYAFIEMGVQYLSDRGKLVQLVPRNIYKNVFGADLRKMLLPNLLEIRELSKPQMFDNALTSSSIFLYDKGKNRDYIVYTDATGKKQRNIPKAALTEKWIFTLRKNGSKKAVRFGDRFHAAMAAVTLLNKAFVIEEDLLKKGLIEPGIVREAAAPKNKGLKKKEYIIFPYFYNKDGDIQRYAEREFSAKFPLAAKHLKKFKKELETRDKDKNVQWFEYGRSQALKHMNQRKLLLSTAITKIVRLYGLALKTIPYSGIYITVVDKNYTLADAEKILKNPVFFRYINDVGVSINGNSKRITCKDINNFEFEE